MEAKRLFERFAELAEGSSCAETAEAALMLTCLTVVQDALRSETGTVSSEAMAEIAKVRQDCLTVLNRHSDRIAARWQ